MGSWVGIPMTHQSKPPLHKEPCELLLESLNTFVQAKSIALWKFSWRGQAWGWHKVEWLECM